MIILRMTIYGLILAQPCCAGQLETALHILTEKLNDLTSALQVTQVDKGVKKSDETHTLATAETTTTSHLELQERQEEGSDERSWLGKLFGTAPKIKYVVTYKFRTGQSIILMMQNVLGVGRENSKSFGRILTVLPDMLVFGKDWPGSPGTEYTKILIEASKQHYDAIAFPSIHGLKPRDGAQIAIQAIVSFFEQYPESSIKKVIFAVWTPNDMSASAEIMKDYIDVLDAKFSKSFKKTTPF